MDITQLFCELIKLNEFNDLSLSYLVNVNKSLNSLIIKTLSIKLNQRHQDCILTGDKTTIYEFINRYLGKVKNPTKILEYDYCKDCNSFGKIKDDICEYGCVINCCGIANIIPRELTGQIVFNCKCNTAIIHKTKSITGDDMCSICLVQIKENNIKCPNCKNIPLRKKVYDTIQFSWTSESDVDSSWSDTSDYDF